MPTATTADASQRSSASTEASGRLMNSFRALSVDLVNAFSRLPFASLLLSSKLAVTSNVLSFVPRPPVYSI